MKSKLIALAIAIAIAAIIFLLCAWCYEAKSEKAEGIFIRIPMWVAGEVRTNGYVRYSIMVHHTQIHPWGTLWKETCVTENGHLLYDSNFPKR